MSNANESAFPVSHVHFQDGPMGGELFGGLTKREYFAAMAMQGLFSAPWHPDMGCDFRCTVEERANIAVSQADALLAELAMDDGGAA